MQEHLHKNDSLCKYQSGFCGNFSKSSCFAQLTDFVLREMDRSFLTGMILVDLKKAFDTLEYTVPLQKMECIGFKESIIKWFQSYLSNRKCFVELEDYCVKNVQIRSFLLSVFSRIWTEYGDLLRKSVVY